MVTYQVGIIAVELTTVKRLLPGLTVAGRAEGPAYYANGPKRKAVCEDGLSSSGTRMFLMRLTPNPVCGPCLGALFLFRAGYPDVRQEQRQDDVAGLVGQGRRLVGFREGRSRHVTGISDLHAVRVECGNVLESRYQVSVHASHEGEPLVEAVRLGEFHLAPSQEGLEEFLCRLLGVEAGRTADLAFLGE